jgi:hypothetical protein
LPNVWQLMKENITTILNDNFGRKKTFSKSELENVLKEYYDRPYQETTYRWRIHDLKSRGIIQNIGRGIYTFPKENKEFKPTITRESKEIFEKIHESLPYTVIALIDTGWFNEFMVNQVFRAYLIIDVEKTATASVFNNLPREYKQSYLNPKREIFDNYIINGDRPVIINSMISESPLIEVDKIKIASLEKLLVDCVSDNLLYAAQQEEEEGIYQRALEKYPVNINKLKRYARRRNREERVTEILEKAESK